jgi:hypothetical protein
MIKYIKASNDEACIAVIVLLLHSSRTLPGNLDEPVLASIIATIFNLSPVI